MRIILLSVFVFSCCTAKLHPDSVSENIPMQKIETVLDKALKQTFYFGAGSTFAAVSNLAYFGWGICQFLPWSTFAENELLLFSQLSASVARQAYIQMAKEFNSSTHLFPVSQFSWHINRRILSAIPAISNENQCLLRFLQERWLSKTAGFSSSAVDWIYPCFDIYMQIHPFTNHCYARLLSTGFSNAYKNRMEAWKQSLPHPHDYPLILTRPANLQDYLPTHLKVSKYEMIRSTAEKLAQNNEEKIVDVTDLFSKEPKEWMTEWQTFRDAFAEACKECHLDMSQILCIQRIHQKEIGGIRLLDLMGQSKETVEKNHRFLVDWVSCFGLAANRVELDRWPAPIDSSLEKKKSLNAPFFWEKEEFLSLLNSFEEAWNKGPPHKTLMLYGTLQVLKGLFTEIKEDNWQEIISCPTRSAIAQFSMNKISQQLRLLAKIEPEASFFSMASHLEQIHADLSSLLEIFAPFDSHRFPSIYQNLLSIPTDLKPFTSCGVHSSAMTSLAGIFKAIEKTVGEKPRMLYGENTYFECVHAAKKATYATPIEEATEEDWEKTDLLLAQFNPVLKPGPHAGYRTEKIEEVLHKCLNARNKKPVTLALDCTIDFLHSPRVIHLLHEFQKEIEEGILNIIGYRSGNKFDLFGMDNYCGSPFFMIHNQDPKWAFFDSLFTDPVLQTDPLSFNWFCLAYQYAAPQLDLYRKQIFENTQALLNKLPSRLLNNRSAHYQVLPFDRDSDPAFIDIKIAGPLHKVRGSTLVGGTLYINSMEGGHPIFNRLSLGFYHPNFIMLFDEENTTLRLTLGLDPAQVDLFAKCLETIDSLNVK